MRIDNHTSPYNFFSKNRRGQFYLIATVIIVAVLVGFITISNYAQERDSVKIYDLSEELNIEGENVLDYGIYKGYSQTETAELLQKFVEGYSEYVGEDLEIYLLVGDEDSIIVIGRGDLAEVNVTFGMTGEVSGDLKPFAKKTFTPEIGDVRNGKIKVKIKQKDYEFELKDGENFYFIISQEIDGETHVETN